MYKTLLGLALPVASLVIAAPIFLSYQKTQKTCLEFADPMTSAIYANDYGQKQAAEAKGMACQRAAESGAAIAQPYLAIFGR